MNKTELIDAVAKKAELSKKDAEKASINATTPIMTGYIFPFGLLFILYSFLFIQSILQI